MGRLAFLWFTALVAAALVATAANKLIQEDAGGGGPGFALQVTPVSAEPVRLHAFADIVEALGTARANESVTVTSKVTDVISRIAFESGDYVEAGQVLAELADAEEAATLTEARSTLAEAQRERDRFEELQSRGVASTQQLDELNSELDRARARVRSIEARLADRILRAPFAGVVGLRDASPGMLVRPGDVIATLDDVSVIKLDFTIPEQFVASVTPGEPIEAHAAAFPDTTFEGRVDHLDSRIDPVTRTAIVRALIDNAEGRLLPGMLLVVEVVRDARETPAVPELAVVLQGEQSFVFVLEEGERGASARRRDVETRARSDGLIEITAGLEVGEMVIAEGVHKLRDGMPVRVQGAEGDQRVALAGPEE